LSSSGSLDQQTPSKMVPGVRCLQPMPYCEVQSGMMMRGPSVFPAVEQPRPRPNYEAYDEEEWSQIVGRPASNFCQNSGLRKFFADMKWGS